MCVLCGPVLRYAGHKSDVLKESLANGFSGEGPSPEDLTTTTVNDIKYIAPQSSDVTIGGESYQRSWYSNPATDLQKPITITYGFASQKSINTLGARANTVLHSTGSNDPGTDPNNPNRLEFTDVQKSSAVEIFNAISEYTNITFEEVDSGENVLLLTGNLTDSVTGLATLPSYGTRNTSQKSGSLILNNRNDDGTDIDEASYKRGAELYKTLIHEIGHTLGLKHPHGNVASSGRITDIPSDNSKMSASDERLSSSNTLMSYREMSVNGIIDLETREIVRRYAKEFQILDVMALQSIYGNNSGVGDDSTHLLTTKWERDKDLGGMQTVVSDDGGTGDKIVGHEIRPNRIDLREGKYFDVGLGHDLWMGNAEIKAEREAFGDESNLVLSRIYKGELNAIIAYGSVIENARGGDESDELSGNDVLNVLEGGKGDDTLRGVGDGDVLKGGEGNDLLSSDGSAIFDGEDGNDTASFANHEQGLTLSVDSGTAWIGTRLAPNTKYYTLRKIENVIGTKHGDKITGNHESNFLVGGLGRDVILGGGGNDVLDGGANDIGTSWTVEKTADETHDFRDDRDDGTFTITRGIIDDNIYVTSKSGNRVTLYPTFDDYQLTGSYSSFTPFTNSSAGSLTIHNGIIASSTVRTNTSSKGGIAEWQEASGLIRIFRYNKDKNKWHQEALIFDKNTTKGGDGDKFGTSLAITTIGEQDYMAVGAPGAGWVYIYKYQGLKGWVVEQIIAKPENGISNFGQKVAFKGRTLLVADDNSKQYHFQFNDWSPHITPSGNGDVTNDTSPNKLFGESGDDRLINRDGAEIFDGGDGTDSVVFYGNSDDFTIVKGVTHIVVTDRDGVIDRLYDIEKIVFLDKEITTTNIEKSSSTAATVKAQINPNNENTITFTSDKEGYAYALAVKEGKSPPRTYSDSEIRKKGIDLKIDKANVEFSLTFDNLDSTAKYRVYLIVEDNEGNVSNTEVITDLQLSVKFSLDSVDSLDQGTHEVKFKLNAPAVVYYAYYTSNDNPTLSSIKQGIDAETHGVHWVAEASTLQSIFLAKSGQGRLYIVIENKIMDVEINVPESLDDEANYLMAVAPDSDNDYLL